MAEKLGPAALEDLGDDPRDVPNYVATQRYVDAYRSRRLYSEAVQRPPDVFGVDDAVDIHCHAHEGQQDALAIAKLASTASMGGLVYKTIAGAHGPGGRPAATVRAIAEELKQWCEETQIEPIGTWAGYTTSQGKAPATPEIVKANLEDGVVALWMPINRSANTLHKVGMPVGGEDSKDHTPPLPWDEAVRAGHYILGDDGKMRREFREIFRLAADFGTAISFGHGTHRELFAMAEVVRDLGIERAFCDHPFSPFVNLTLEEMKQFTAAGIYMNFTFDEISPLLGVDPALMCKTIQEIGTHHVTISSDAGEPMFPNSVECIRLIRAYMRAYGLTEQQVSEISVINPKKLIGIA